MLIENSIPPDFSAAYPSYRDELLRKAEENTEARLAIRSNTIRALQSATDIETQASLIDLLTQISDTAGWWIPPPSSDPQRLERYKNILETFKLHASQMQELIPQTGNPTGRPKNPSLRNDSEDAYMQLATQEAIFGAGYINIPGVNTDSRNPFLDFISQYPEVLNDIKTLCSQAYEEWDNLSAPRIPEYIAYVANQHNPSVSTLGVDYYIDTWQNHRKEILEATRDYPINTYSPKSPRYQVMFEKTLSDLQSRTASVASRGDFGSGITFGPLENLVHLIRERGMPVPTNLYAYDIFPERFTDRKDVDGVRLVYTRQDIANRSFTARPDPSLNFAMSLSVLPHLRSRKRLEIIKGMLRKSPAILIEGALYGRNYWDEEDPKNLLPRFPKSEHNGWLFLKNQRGGLDFTPLTSRSIPPA